MKVDKIKAGDEIVVFNEFDGSLLAVKTISIRMLGNDIADVTVREPDGNMFKVPRNRILQFTNLYTMDTIEKVYFKN